MPRLAVLPPAHPLQECAETLYAEIDYIAEGRNADRFRRNFREQPWVKVPRVYWQHWFVGGGDGGGASCSPSLCPRARPFLAVPAPCR